MRKMILLAAATVLVMGLYEPGVLGSDDGTISECYILPGGGFESGVFPPAGWTHIQTNPNQTWKIQVSGSPYEGLHAADCEYDQALGDQDEWLITPYIRNPSRVNFWSFGSLYWCRDINDNCDLEVWLINGPGVNDGDDIFLGKADDDWVATWTYSQSIFSILGSIGTPVRIGFRYVGKNGAQIALDKVMVCTDYLYGNGPIITHPTGGADGNHASALQSNLGMGTYGFGAQITLEYSVADDFTVTGDGWTIKEMHFFAYQTGSGTTSTLNDLRIQIYDGPPNAGGAVIWGDLTTNRLTSTEWTNIYRVNITDLTNTSRPIMRAVAQLEHPIVLFPGTYWVEYQLGGTLSSGPFVPPLTSLGVTTTGNALQNISGTWNEVRDSGTNTPQGLPFWIFGYAHPSYLRMGVKGSTNNNIYFRRRGWGSWEAWETLSGATSHAPAMAEFNDKLYMVVKGATNNNLYISSLDSSDTWSSWSPLGGQTTLSPALVAFNNKLYLFVKGATNNNIYYRSMDAWGTWSSWSMVPGGTTNRSPAPAVFKGELWLFVKGETNNNLYFNKMNTYGVWSGWEKFETGATSEAPAVVTYDGHGYIFVKGATNNNIYYIRDDWSSWMTLSGATTKTPSLAASPLKGLLYLTVKGATNNNIYYKMMNPLGYWSSWFMTDGSTSDTPALSAY